MGWVGWGGVCKVIFVLNPTPVEVDLRLCRVEVGVLTTKSLVVFLYRDEDRNHLLMKKMIENWLYPITRGKWGGRFELVFIATDESRMQVSILRPLHEFSFHIT